MPTENQPRFVDAAELAKILGVSKITIFRWAASGTIPPGQRVGRRLRRWLVPSNLANFLGSDDTAEENENAHR